MKLTERNLLKLIDQIEIESRNIQNKLDQFAREFGEEKTREVFGSRYVVIFSDDISFTCHPTPMLIGRDFDADTELTFPIKFLKEKEWNRFIKKYRKTKESWYEQYKTDDV